MTKLPRRDARILDTQHLRAVTGGDKTTNQQETLSSNVQKKRDDVTAGVRDKI